MTQDDLSLILAGFCLGIVTCTAVVITALLILMNRGYKQIVFRK